MRFFTTFTIIMIAVLFIFLDIAKRNTAFLLYRVLLRAGLITFISIVGFFYSQLLYLFGELQHHHCQRLHMENFRLVLNMK